jgi:hypothetical protein
MGEYWHAVAMLRLDRPLGLEELEGCFRAGTPARGLVGERRGRLLAVTMGYGMDAPLEALARAWMPWRGKSFSREGPEGRNLFTSGGGRALRVGFPAYREVHEDDRLGTTAFRFATSIGPSATVPDLDVLRLDYRGIAENPSFPIRRILDEVVQIDTGLWLGQALMQWDRRLRRAAWFSLESTQPQG